MNTLNFIKLNARYLCFGFIHFFSSAVGQTYFVGLFVAALTAQMGWAEDTFATIYSSITLVAAFTLPIVGKQIDRFSVRYVSTVVVITLACALVGLAYAPNVVFFGTALYLIRLGGQGVLPLIGSTTIGRYFEEGRGKALALTNVGKSVAEVLVPPIVVAALAVYSYQTVWKGTAVYLLVLVLPAIWLLIRKRDVFQRADAVLQAQQEVSGKSIASSTRSEALKDRRLILILPAYVLAPFVITGVVFNQALIADARAFTPIFVAYGISAYGIARSICVLLGGPFVDRYGPERLLLFIHLPLLMGLLIFASLATSWALMAFFILCGIGMGAESVLWPALWAERYGPTHLGSIKSAIRVFMVLGTAISPLLFSWGFAADLSLSLYALLLYGVLAVALVWSQRI